MNKLLLILILFSSVRLISQWKEINSPRGKVLLNEVLTTEDALFSYWYNAIYKSYDKGTTWEKLQPKGLDSIVDYDYFYTNANNLYLINYTFNNRKGIFRSTDGGENFELISEKYFTEIKVFKDKFFVSNNNLLSTEDFVMFDTLVKGKNGYSFNQIEFINDIIIYYDKGANSSNPPVLNDGIIYSVDNGKTWLEWHSGLTKNSALYNDVFFTDSISYIATSNGIYKAEGIGEIWERLEIPSSSKDIKFIEMYDNKLYFTTSDYEIYYSENLGISWKLFEHNSISRINNMNLVNGRLFIAGLGLYEIVNNELHEIELYDNVNLFELDFIQPESLILQTMTGMYVSDVDNKWSLINDSIETSFYRFSINDSLIMSHFSNSNLLYYSNDLGKSWKDTSIVQKSESILEVNIFGDVITIVTRNMLVYSNDRGNSWINFNENNPDFNIRFRKIYQIKDDIFLASTFNNGILISEDNCKTWKKITDSDETTLSYETTFYIANYGNNIIVPRYNFENTTSEFYYSSNLGRSWELKKFTDNNIYIENLINYKDNIFMTTTNGFMYSTDFGFTWDTHNENIEMDSATIKNTFAFRDLDLNDGKLYLTMNNKVFYLNLSELGIKYTSVERTENRNYLYTYPPYPLPSNKEIKIKAHWDSTIPFTSEDIVIYNLAGIKINTEDKLRILKETNYSGHIIWDTSNEEAGIYIVYIKHGTEMRACKILVE